MNLKHVLMELGNHLVMSRGFPPADHPQQIIKAVELMPGTTMIAAFTHWLNKTPEAVEWLAEMGIVWPIFPVDPTCELLEKAARLIVSKGIASASLLQRELGIDYTRAAFVLDDLEAELLIGPFNGTNPRAILIGGGEVDEFIRRLKARRART